MHDVKPGPQDASSAAVIATPWRAAAVTLIASVMVLTAMLVLGGGRARR